MLTLVLIAVLKIAAIVAAAGLVFAAAWFAYTCAVLPLIIREWRTKERE